MDKVMIKEYLELLDCPDAVKPCRENLFRIQQSHLEKIAYSNLPIFVSGYIPTLDVESLFNRIVRLRRGGYCFELNGLLFRLLLCFARSKQCVLLNGMPNNLKFLLIIQFRSSIVIL